eukprot:1595860-Pyramimonas_sp.AAC.1
MIGMHRASLGITGLSFAGCLRQCRLRLPSWPSRKTLGRHRLSSCIWAVLDRRRLSSWRRCLSHVGAILGRLGMS